MAPRTAKLPATGANGASLRKILRHLFWDRIARGSLLPRRRKMAVKVAEHPKLRNNRWTWVGADYSMMEFMNQAMEVLQRDHLSHVLDAATAVHESEDVWPARKNVLRPAKLDSTPITGHRGTGSGMGPTRFYRHHYSPMVVRLLYGLPELAYSWTLESASKLLTAKVCHVVENTVLFLSDVPDGTLVNGG